MGNRSSHLASNNKHPYYIREVERMRLNGIAPVEWETSKIVRDKKTGSVEVIRMKKN